MFRKLKKWYFKIYHLFKLIGIFILIFGIKKNVYAEVMYEEYQRDFKIANESCSKNIFPPYMITGAYFRNNNDYYQQGQNSNRASYIMEVEKNTNYYMYKFNYSVNYPYIYLIDESLKPYKEISLSFKNNKATITTDNKVKYIGFQDGLYNWQTTWEYMISKEDNLTEFIEFKECSSTPDVPIQNEVYSNFLSLYTEKLSYLANGFTTNPYLLAMIGIIFSFVFLELFLQILHIRGGYHK